MAGAFDLDGKVVLITGGANGIGAAIARSAADAGARVVVFDVAEDAGTALADGHDSIAYRRLDVTDHDAVHRAVATIVAEYGRVDGLVCGAIVQPIVPVVEMAPDLLRRVLAVNVEGVVWMCKAVAPEMMRRNSGSIVLFASGTADFGKPNSSPYTASKGAVAGFAHTFAKEVQPYGVRVNLLRPGVIDTPQFRGSNPGADYTALDRPDVVTGPALFLLSDHASMTNSIVTREGSLPREPRVFA